LKIHDVSSGVISFGEIAPLCFSPEFGSSATLHTTLLQRSVCYDACMSQPYGMTSMDRASPDPHSQLFTVRLWLEALGDGQVEWRGNVQHVMSGELRYFRDWPTLIEFLIAMQSDRGSESAEHRRRPVNTEHT